MKTHAFRLTKGTDLKKEIEKYAEENNIKAGCVVSAVGCLTQVTLRSAGAKKEKTFVGEYEITSITVTISSDGAHLHISCADSSFNMLGGHLKESSLVDTTAEIVILEFPNYNFKRKLDPNTGYKELVISSNMIQKL